MPRRTQYFNLMCSALLLLGILNITTAEPKQQQTPARILAKQTGATQFEEERFETHADCNEQHKHHLKKRASDEDVDYEVYQGVVGRPGIDFPIHPRIPKTSFSCRSYGNGYFADMETDCQVFHICEEGRKISFLCPNGTIFQQSELTCDWWFKVNCLGSSGYYAESAEILNKQRVQRIRPSVPVQGFNIVGGGLNIKPKIVSPQVTHKASSHTSDRRIDSNEEPVLESVDFEDVSNEKNLNKGSTKTNPVLSNIDNNNNNNDDESQITAESASFVTGKRRNDFADNEHKASNRGRDRERGTKRGNGRQNSGTDERARHGQRGQSRYREDKKPLAESIEQTASEESRESSRKVLPEKIVQQPASNGRANSISSIPAPDSAKPEFYNPSTTRPTVKLPTTTPYQSSGTYTTARRLESTRVTPYYTPTVPTLTKSKTTEGKGFYIKAKPNNNAVASTPNPNRVSSNGGSYFETSSRPGKSSQSEFEQNGTQRPFIIGMRSNKDSQIHRLVIDTSQHFNVDSPIQKPQNKKEDQLPTSTVATTGPTYLPKSAATPKPSKKTVESAGSTFLFAPSPGAAESVSRNLDEMLKTMNLLKNKLESTPESKTRSSQQREGLEIPPSSGPDALVSLAKYFATETSDAKQKPNTVDVVQSNNNSKERLSGVKVPAPGSKPSDTTATITTTANPNIANNADDIKASLLSSKTVAKYTDLFGLKEDASRQQTTDPSTGLLSNANSTDNIGNAYAPFPQIGSTDATIKKLAEKPESRKIAQVFSNALNTYLEDPVSFRAQLASVRPTEPPPTTIANEDATNKLRAETTTAKQSRLFNSGTGATYLPTKPPTTTGVYDTTTATSIAAEINSNFDYSTPQSFDYGSTTEVTDSPATTTKAKELDASEIQKLKLELSAELLPPSADSGEGEEILQRSHTQSFVKSRNNNNRFDTPDKQSNKKSEKLTNLAVKPTETPWNQISESDYLDPLTINDGLMKEHASTTFSPFTYLPKETTTQLNVKAESKVRGHSPNTQRFAQTSARSFAGSESSVDNWQDILSSYDLPHDALPSSSGLQRIANKLFGGLNENEALHLKNVMAQAEHNRQVLSLLLLLIQTCDDQNGKALERSRKHLLNALIDMDGKIEHGKRAYHKDKKNAANTASTTTTRIPVTTYRRSSEDYLTSTPNYAQQTTTTDLPATTETTTANQEETTKFEIRVPDFDEEDQLDTTTTTTTTGTVKTSTAPTGSLNSDKRALELLKSLYSLASKFTSRR